MVSGNPFLDDDDVDENDLDLSLGLQDLLASNNQDSADAVAGGFGFGLDDDTDDEDDLALPSLDDYDEELLSDDQIESNFSSTVDSEHNLDNSLSVDNHAQNGSSVSTDVDTDTEDEILFDDDDDSTDFEDRLDPDAGSGGSESSRSSDESHGSIIYGDFDEDDEEFIFDDDEDEDNDFSDNSFISSPSDGVLDADGVRDIVRRLEMAGAEPEDKDTYDDEIDEDDDNFAWVDDDDSSSESGSPFMQRGLLSGGPESDDDEDEEGGWSFEDVPPVEEGFSDSQLFEDDDETLFDDDEDEDDLYDFDSPDSTDFLTNDSSDRDQTGFDTVSNSDQDNNSEDDGKSSDSGTPEGSLSGSEGSSDSKTGDDTKSDDSSFTERLKAFASGLGERVSSVVTDIKNDLRGHDGEIPDSRSDKDDDSENEPESEDSNSSKPKESKKGKGGSNNPLKSSLSIIGGFYNKIVGIFFKILTSVLGVLAGIPVIGRPFKIALAATRVLEVIAKSAPALLLIVGLVTMSWMSVPSSTTTELPDEGNVEFSSFSYSNGGTALGVMKNTGEVSVEGQAQFTVYSLQPGWNPKSWFIYQAEKTCESNVVTVDIESQTEVSASCGQASGWLPRVSGTIK
jgi:AAA ATPase containing von willebrand factor type A (VWA)-like domain